MTGRKDLDVVAEPEVDNQRGVARHSSWTKTPKLGLCCVVSGLPNACWKLEIFLQWLARFVNE
jgi:hypothetical protein